MDGVSSVIGILDFSLKTSTGILGYAMQVKSADKDIETLKTELRFLQKTLFRAEELVTNSDSQTDGWTPVNESSFEPYLKLLNGLEGKLKKRISRFRYPFVSTSLRKNIEDVQKFRTMIDTEILIKLKQQKDRDELYKCLSPSDPSQRHNDLHKKRHGTAGDWFIEGDDFKQWEKSHSASLLWIYGIPGCGKSVLASRIIDAVNTRCNNRKAEKLGMAYFYFDFSVKENRRITRMIRSIIWQLAIRSSAADKVMTNSLSGYLNKSQPNDNVLLICLDAMLKEFDESFIIIDALDECEDEGVMKIVQQIAGGQHNLRLLLTSRREVYIEKTIRNLKIDKTITSLGGDGINNDIRKYIQFELQQENWYFDRWHGNKKIQMQIEEKLVEKADGMFRWVECQLIALRNFYEIDKHGKLLCEQLDSLPETLDETYERILCSVVSINRQKTLTLLRWLSFSARPLTIREAVETMLIDENIDRSAFDTSRGIRMPCDILMNLCPGLINTVVTTGKNTRNVDRVTESDELRLAHFSVKEYLQSLGIRDGEVSFFSVQRTLTNSYLARACLLYMLQFESSTITEEALIKYPLATYSAEYWAAHARIALFNGSSDPRLEQQIGQLFASSTKLLTWIKLFDPDIGRPRHDAAIDSLLSPLYYAAMCGLPRQFKLLIDGGADINVLLVPGAWFSDPLIVRPD